MPPVGNMNETCRYRIPRHVYLCEVPGGAVFLDAKRNLYLGIEDPRLQDLATIVEAWPLRAASPRPACDTAGSEAAVAAALAKRGLLTTDDVGIDSALLTHPPPVVRNLTSALLAPHVRIRVLHVFRFVLACLYAAAALRWSALCSIMERATADRNRFAGRALDLAAVAELAEVFQRLFATFFSARERCMFCSLAMLKFLAAYGVSATWVIGIRTHPFSAHSWVQYCGVVLSEVDGQAGQFQPLCSI